MNVNLGPIYKIQVPDVHCLDIQDKHFTLCKKNIYIHSYKKVRYNVSIQIDKTTTSRKTVKLEIGTNPLRAMREGGGIFLANQLPRTRTNSPAEFLFESGRHDISHTRVSLTFK